VTEGPELAVLATAVRMRSSSGSGRPAPSWPWARESRRRCARRGACDRAARRSPRRARHGRRERRAPALYAFLPGIEKVRSDPEPGVTYDLVVLCDCGDLSRVGPIRERNAALFAATPLLTIDHHASNDGAGDLAWIDPGAAATSEMVALLAVRLGVPLTAGDGELATVLTAGSSWTPPPSPSERDARTLRVAAALVEAGAPLSDISRQLYAPSRTRSWPLRRSWPAWSGTPTGWWSPR